MVDNPHIDKKYEKYDPLSHKQRIGTVLKRKHHLSSPGMFLISMRRTSGTEEEASM